MQPGRANNFDALRLLGALLVFYSHQFPLAGLPDPWIDADKSTTPGTLGVFLFFSISGFLVCQSWVNDPNADRFIRRRFLRIWPGLTAAVLGSALFVFAFTPATLGATLTYMVNIVWLGHSKGLFFMDNPLKPMYGSLWTIPVEVLCYGVLMALGMLLGRRLPAVLAWGAAVGVLLLMAWPALVQTEFFLTTLLDLGWRWPIHATCMAYFGLGAVLCVRPELMKRAWITVAGGALLILGGETRMGLLFAVPFAVVWVGQQSWPVLRNAGHFGDLSYGIYLWSWPVQQAVVMFFGRSLPLAGLAAVSLTVTVALAFASWHLVEKRALKLKPPRVPGSPTATGLSGYPSSGNGSQSVSPAGMNRSDSSCTRIS